MVCAGHRTSVHRSASLGIKVIRGGTTRIVSRLVLSGTEERGVVSKYGFIYSHKIGIVEGWQSVDFALISRY